MTSKHKADPGMTAHLPSGERLLLIDGTNLVRTVFEANPTPNAEERVKSALQAARGSFSRALREMEPTHVLVAFDFGGNTWRHQLYAAYRAGRKPMPQELRRGLDEFIPSLETDLGLRCVSLPDVEADDVLATAARHWVSKHDGACIVLSTDKDMLQLVADGVHIRDHFKHLWKDEQYLVGKYGVGAARFGDYLALTGDSVDGVPGVKGIGKKTAAALLAEHGSLDACLGAACSVKGNLGQLLQDGGELARLSRRLIDFKTDIRLGVSWNDLRYAAKG